MNQISIVGNLTADPKLHISDDGKPRSTFTVAVNEGEGDNERTHFVNVTAFGTLGENFAASGTKGQRIIVIGRLNTYKRRMTVDGEEKDITMTGFTASAVGPDTRWAIAKVTKVVREGNGNGATAEAPAAASTNGARGGSGGSTGAAAPAAVAVAEDDDDF